jgi:hypothetical protein
MHTGGIRGYRLYKRRNWVSSRDWGHEKRYKVLLCCRMVSQKGSYEIFGSLIYRDDINGRNIRHILAMPYIGILKESWGYGRMIRLRHPHIEYGRQEPWKRVFDSMATSVGHAYSQKKKTKPIITLASAHPVGLAKPCVKRGRRVYNISSQGVARL